MYSAPPPPSPGQIATGPDYVIMTVADGNPTDPGAAQQLVTDAVFEFLMPRYCALPRNTGFGCVTNYVQWGIETYDAGGNPKISACAVSGCGFHYCSISNGYITAVLRGEFANPSLTAVVGVIAVGSDAVMMTIAMAILWTWERRRQLAPDAVFESLMRTYCALPGERESVMSVAGAMECRDLRPKRKSKGVKLRHQRLWLPLLHCF